jgi:hypothetical protein
LPISGRARGTSLSGVIDGTRFVPPASPLVLTGPLWKRPLLDERYLAYRIRTSTRARSIRSGPSGPSMTTIRNPSTSTIFIDPLRRLPSSCKVYRCPPMSTDVHRCPPMSTDVHRCPPMSTDVHQSPPTSTGPLIIIDQLTSPHWSIGLAVDRLKLVSLSTHRSGSSSVARMAAQYPKDDPDRPSPDDIPNRPSPSPDQQWPLDEPPSCDLDRVRSSRASTGIRAGKTRRSIPSRLSLQEGGHTNIKRTRSRLDPPVGLQAGRTNIKRNTIEAGSSRRTSSRTY